MKKYILVAIFSALIILWVSFIWSNSSQVGEVSGQTSSDITDRINEIVEPIIKEPISEHTVRKSAHFLEYMILGALCSVDVIFVLYACSACSARLVSFSMLASLLPSFAVAMIDEFSVQASTEGRGPSFIDVGIDCAGAFTGIAISLAVFLITYYLSEKRKCKSDSN